jgi:hypothetical protein
MKRRELLIGTIGSTLGSAWLSACGGGGNGGGGGGDGGNAVTPIPGQPKAQAVVVTVGSDDAAKTIQTVLDQVKASGRRSTPIQIDSAGAFTLASGITLDPYFHDVDFMGAVVTYTSTSGAAITVQGTTPSAPTQLIGGVNNINLRGPVAGTATGILFTGTVAGTRTSCANSQITTEGFDVAIDFGDFGYLTHFHDLAINGFGSIGLRQRGGGDSGENISVHGGVITNGQGTAIVAEDDTVEIFLYGVSLDYNVRVIDIKVAGGNVELHGGHIEYNGGTAVADQIKVTGNGSSFKMFGGYWTVNTLKGDGPYSFAYTVNVATENSYVVLDKVRLVNHANTADLWATGPGRVITKDCILFSVSMMPHVIHVPSSELQDGSFERSDIADFWYVANDQAAAYSGRYNGGAMTVALDSSRARSGSRSLKMQRGAVGTGFSQTGGLAIPVTHLRNRFIVANCFGLSDMAGRTRLSVLWGALRGMDVNARPVWESRVAYAANFFAETLTPDKWHQLAITNGLPVPPWATHLILEFDITDGEAGRSLWIDDVTFNAW